MYKLTEKQKKEFEFYKYHDDDKVMFVLNQATKVLGSTVGIAIFNPLL